MNYKEYEKCGVNVFLSMLSGKWKPLILYQLFIKEERFTDLWRVMPKVSKKVLLEQLKQMEADGIVVRKQNNVFPPEVYYKLSEKGLSLGPVLLQIEKWNETHHQIKSEG